MPAYVLAEIEITNPEAYKEYTKAVPATVEKYGGKFLHRGGEITKFEGEWPERRRVIIEFPSAAVAQQWWDSTEYAKPKAMRRAASNGRLLLFHGL
jgi:uncharacterized protein (DUF1330 family)